MLQRFRDQFGTAGLVVAVVALIAALAGTALAASGGLSGKQKKEVTKIAKKYAGKKGDKGDPGSAGNNGNNGTNGNNGADGQSVEVVPAGAACAANGGGSSFKVGGVVKGSPACNGKEGEEGPEGSPWTAGGTLPPGETETGTWGGQFLKGSTASVISIPIPLPSAPEGVFVGKNEPQKEKGEDEGCDGFVDGVPVADPGKLCVYLTNELGTIKPFENEPFPEVFFVNPQVPVSAGTAPEGATLFFTCEAEPTCVEFGSWAVTAPEEP